MGLATNVSAPVVENADSGLDGRTGAHDRRPGLEAAQWASPLGLLVAFIAVFAFALSSRLVGLGGAVTEDEDQWIARSANFARALRAADWQRTYQTGHPGVSAMWITALALGPERAARLADNARGTQRVTESADFLPALRQARLPFAVLNAALATAVGLLAWRLLGPGAGVLGGLLMALDPYWSAVGPIVGMDGLLSGLVAGSLLSLLLAWRSASRPLPWAVLSGALFGLAVLSKTTAVFVLPMLPAMALLQLRGRPVDRQALKRVAYLHAAWLGTAALVLFFSWPAMYGQPLNVVSRVLQYSVRQASSPHGPGSYFLGQPVSDPGPLFYPLALGLRLGPGTALGLALLIVFGIPRKLRATVWTLTGFALLFGILLTASAKKLDRYLLPTMPILDVLAGLGWWRGACWLLSVPTRDAAGYLPGRPLYAGLIGTASVVLLLQLWPLMAAGGYPLAAYNPLIGGARTAERVMQVGWGDGLDHAGQLLRELSRDSSPTISIWYPLWVNFQAHAPGRVVTERQLSEADYFVDYIHARQRGHTPERLVGRQPDAVVRIAGVDYARIYRLH